MYEIREEEGKRKRYRGGTELSAPEMDHQARESELYIQPVSPVGCYWEDGEMGMGNWR